MSVPTVSGEELDRIGDLGELEFARLCRRAGLQCGKMQPDRTGKDFTVEFNLARTNPGSSLDKRPPPVQIAVQVKTILAKNDTARISLSVAERLAKDTRPALIAIFRINDDDSFVDLHIVHLIGSQLGRVLKALRKASLKQDPRLHDMTISFKVKQSERVGMEKDSFHAAIAKIPNGDMHSYAARKSRQFEELGFDAERFNMRFTPPQSSDEIISGFLAQRPMKVSNAVLTERRFDIDMPMDIAASGTINITPVAHTTGQTVLRSALLEVVLASEFIVVPEFIAGVGNSAMLAKTELGDILLKQGSLIYKQSPEYGEESLHTAADWKRYLELGVIVGSADFLVECTSDTVAGRLDFKVTELSASYDTGLEGQFLNLLQFYSMIADSAGFRENRFTLPHLRSQGREILLIATAMTEAAATFECRSDVVEAPEFSQAIGALVSPVNIAGVWIGLFMPVSVELEVDGDQIVWKGEQTRKAVVEKLPAGDIDEAFDAFRKKYCDLLEIPLTFVQKPGEFMAASSAPTIVHSSMSGPAN